MSSFHPYLSLPDIIVDFKFDFQVSFLVGEDHAISLASRFTYNLSFNLLHFCSCSKIMVLYASHSYFS